MTTQVMLDQAAGQLTLHTGRAGVASRAGHDLTLRLGKWTARAEVEADGTVRTVRLVALLPSLEVVRGDGGLKPLSDKDKSTILGHAAETLRTKQHSEVVFEASDVRLAEGQSTLTGTVTIAGVSQPITLELTVQDTNRVRVRGEVVQSAFGIKPFTGMLGALKVRDMVEVKADLTLPAR